MEGNVPMMIVIGFVFAITIGATALEIYLDYRREKREKNEQPEKELD